MPIYNRSHAAPIACNSHRMRPAWNNLLPGTLNRIVVQSLVQGPGYCFFFVFPSNEAKLSTPI